MWMQWYMIKISGWRAQGCRSVVLSWTMGAGSCARDGCAAPPSTRFGHFVYSVETQLWWPAMNNQPPISTESHWSLRCLSPWAHMHKRTCSFRGPSPFSLASSWVFVVFSHLFPFSSRFLIKSVAIESWNRVLGKGMRRSKNQWREAPFHWIMARHSVNEGFGKEFYRKSNLVKRLRPFSESPDFKNWNLLRSSPSQIGSKLCWLGWIIAQCVPMRSVYRASLCFPSLHLLHGMAPGAFHR